MSDPVFQRRRRNAFRELHQRGVAGGNGMPAGMRLILQMFPNQRPPYYGDRRAFFVQMSISFGLFVTPFIWLIFAMDRQNSAIWVLAWGLGCGVVFAAIFVPYLAFVHRRMGLTDWEDLDRYDADGDAEA